jgi:hypothetical protein
MNGLPLPYNFFLRAKEFRTQETWFNWKKE